MRLFEPIMDNPGVMHLSPPLTYTAHVFQILHPLTIAGFVTNFLLIWHRVYFPAIIHSRFTSQLRLRGESWISPRNLWLVWVAVHQLQLQKRPVANIVRASWLPAHCLTDCHCLSRPRLFSCRFPDSLSVSLMRICIVSDSKVTVLVHSLSLVLVVMMWSTRSIFHADSVSLFLRLCTHHHLLLLMMLLLMMMWDQRNSWPQDLFLSCWFSPWFSHADSLHDSLCVSLCVSLSPSFFDSLSPSSNQRNSRQRFLILILWFSLTVVWCHPVVLYCQGATGIALAIIHNTVLCDNSGVVGWAHFTRTHTALHFHTIQRLLLSLSVGWVSMQPKWFQLIELITQSWVSTLITRKGPLVKHNPHTVVRRLGLGICPSTSHSHSHSLTIKSKKLKTKIYSHAHSLILTHYHLYLLLWWNQRNSRSQDPFSCWFSDSLSPSHCLLHRLTAYQSVRRLTVGVAGKSKEPQLYVEHQNKVAEYQEMYSRTWTQCQSCQGSMHLDVLCTSRDCPIFYLRKKVQKDLKDATVKLDRFNMEW